MVHFVINQSKSVSYFESYHIVTFFSDEGHRGVLQKNRLKLYSSATDGGLTVSALDSWSRGLGNQARSLRCVLEQNALPSQSLSPGHPGV